MVAQLHKQTLAMNSARTRRRRHPIIIHQATLTTLTVSLVFIRFPFYQADVTMNRNIAQASWRQSRYISVYGIHLLQQQNRSSSQGD